MKEILKELQVQNSVSSICLTGKRPRDGAKQKNHYAELTAKKAIKSGDEW